MKDISSRQIIGFLAFGISLALICSLAISKSLSEAVSMESRNRDLSVLFGAIEAGPLAIARLQSSAIAQEQLNLLMANSQLNERGLLGAKIVGGPEFKYTFAAWKSAKDSLDGCEKLFEKTFEFVDALNPFRISVVRDECFVVAEQKQILKYSSLATILVALVTLLLFAVSIWPVARSIRSAEQAFTNGFKKVGKISFRPVRMLVREGIRNAELEREQALTTLAQQVSHDIRSPLSALQMAIKVITEIPEEKAAIIRNATSRITAIADRLMERRRGLIQDSNNAPPLRELIDRLIIEKRTEIADRSGIFLRADFQGDECPKTPMESSDFTRVLSNLLNNSIEAIDKAGTITLGIRSNGPNTDIYISDDGKGIPAELIAKLGEESLSFGKKNGSGMGIVNARRSVESVGGRFSIQSKINMGTIVRLSFREAL